MDIKVSWIQNGSTYKRMEGDISNVIAPPKGIYNIGLSMTGWYLEYYAKEFVFDYKLYGLETDFVNHVMYTYENTKGNLGILLNGIKGTGKSVTAKDLANKMNLPIVIVKSFGDKNDALIEFLSSFNFDCIFFFDEFEKNFDKNDSSILQLMDGVYNSKFRKIFLLTTNETKINDNLISRPSRLRYIHEFKNIKKEVAEEYLKDNLKENENISKLLDFIDTLQISTIDILKSICEEVNIFGIEEFLRTKHYFNIKNSTFSYRCYKTQTHVDRIKELSYDITKFISDVDKYENPIIFTDKRENYSNDAEFNNAIIEFNNKNKPILSINNYYLSNKETPFKLWKVGDVFEYNSEHIINIDYKHGIVVVLDEDDNYVYFYKIINPNQTPSLYNQFINPYASLF